MRDASFLRYIRISTGIEGWRRLREQTSRHERLDIRLPDSQLGQLIIVHRGAPLKAQFLSTAPKTDGYFDTKSILIIVRFLFRLNPQPVRHLFLRHSFCLS